MFNIIVYVYLYVSYMNNKKVLKQNLLVKQLMQTQPNPIEIHHKNEQQNNDIDIVTAITFKPTDTLHNDDICKDDDSEKKQLTKKQELLERNRYLNFI